MSNWRKFGDRIIDVSKFIRFGVGSTEYSKGKFLIFSDTDRDLAFSGFNLTFDTEQEAMEYLIKALREDICP